MTYKKYPTPTETRSWDTSERETYRDYLTLERRAEKLEPEEKEMEAINRTAIVLSFASNSCVKPVEFLNRVYGAVGKEPLSQPRAERCTQGLKFAYAIHREINDQIEAGVLDERHYPCPRCERQASAFAGPLIFVGDDGLEPTGDCLVSVNLACSCQLDIEDVAKIEREVGAQEQFFATGV